MPNIIIYDKARYHYEGNYPEGLRHDNAYVYIGMFLGWLCDVKLISGQFKDDFKTEIDRYKRREITGAVLLRLSGGALVSDMLSDEGNRFAGNYYKADVYIDDFCEILVRALPSIYHVEDTWENYERLKSRIDERYLKSKR